MLFYFLVALMTLVVTLLVIIYKGLIEKHTRDYLTTKNRQTPNL